MVDKKDPKLMSTQKSQRSAEQPLLKSLKPFRKELLQLKTQRRMKTRLAGGVDSPYNQIP